MNQKCVIISGAADDTAVVQRTYEELFPGIPVTTNEDFEVTEIAKYMRNCFLAVKVAFANEIAHVCEKNNVPYNDVLGMMLSQGGIEPGHFKVPGPDGKRGYGGACFPKDVRALMTYAQKNGVVSFILRAAETLNQVIRPHDANCKEIN